MASFVTLTQELRIDSADGNQGGRSPITTRWVPGAGVNGKREQITLTASAFTALSPPTSAKAVMLILGTAINLTLKGVTGDTGTKLVPATLPLGFDAIIPLGASPSIGITSAHTSDQTIEVIWL